MSHSNDYNSVIELLSSFSIYFYYVISILISICVIAITHTVMAKINKSKLKTADLKNSLKLDSTEIEEIQNRNSDDEENAIYEKYFEDEHFFDNNLDTSDPRINASVILGKLKAAKFKAVEETLSVEQKEVEKEIEKEQLASIYDLLRKQEEQHNLGVMNEDEFHAQLSLYR